MGCGWAEVGSLEEPEAWKEGTAADSGELGREIQGHACPPGPEVLHITWEQRHRGKLEVL